MGTEDGHAWDDEAKEAVDMYLTTDIATKACHLA